MLTFYSLAKTQGRKYCFVQSPVCSIQSTVFSPQYSVDSLQTSNLEPKNRFFLLKTIVSNRYCIILKHEQTEVAF